MEKQQWTTPVWSKNARPFYDGTRKDMHYTYPDWGNAGPGVFIPAQHMNSLWLEPSISSSSSCFDTLKDIQKKFPLQDTLQHSYPVLQPQKLYSQHNFQYTLAGNCLDAVEIGGQTMVVHVKYSSNDQAVVASRLVPGRYFQNDKLMEGDPYFHLERQNDVLLDQDVYQVVAKALHNDVQVLVRTPTTVQLSSLRQTGFGKENLETLSGSITSDAALSNAQPGLWSLVTVTGKVTLHDADAKQPVWTTHCKESKGIVNAPDRIFKCGFGRHPLFLFVGNENSVYLYDTRVHPDSYRTLFDSRKIKDDEHICSFVSSGDQPHLYLVMNESVYVVDDRQQKTPLMHWRHMLSNSPTFSTINKLDSLELLILSNSQNKEVGMISSEWECGGQQCHGVSVPCHFSFLHDTSAFAHSHGLWFTNQVQERLEDSVWLGMTSLPHPFENNSSLFLSMYSSGDIFLNTFQTSYTNSHSTVFSEDEQELIILRKWETDVVDISTHSWSYHNVNYFDVTDFCQQIYSRPISRHVEKMLATLPNIRLSNSSFNSVEINGLVKNEKKEQEFSNSENSTKCSKNISYGKKNNHGLTKSESETRFIWNLKDQVLKSKSLWQTKFTGCAAWSKSLMETYIIDPILDPSIDLPLLFRDSCTEDSLGKFLPGSLLLDMKMDKIKRCKDFLSPRIISLWLDGKNINIKYEGLRIGESETCSTGRLSGLLGATEVPEIKNEFQYHNAPLDIARLSAKLSAYHPDNNSANQSLEVDKLCESHTYPSQTTLEISVNSHGRSKRTAKKLKKKKRLDGF